MSAEVEAFVRDYLASSGAPEAHAVGPGFNFIDEGALDSMGVMHLVVALEDRFDVELKDEDIVSDAFRTIGGLACIVARACAMKAA